MAWHTLSVANLILTQCYTWHSTNCRFSMTKNVTFRSNYKISFILTLMKSRMIELYILDIYILYTILSTILYTCSFRNKIFWCTCIRWCTLCIVIHQHGQHCECSHQTGVNGRLLQRNISQIVCPFLINFACFFFSTNPSTFLTTNKIKF